MPRAIDTRIGAEIRPGQPMTDHCGHQAKLIKVVSPVMVEAVWPDGLTGSYPVKMFSLKIVEDE